MKNIRSLGQAKDFIKRAAARAARAKEQYQEQLDLAVSNVVVGVVAGGFGYARQRFGQVPKGAKRDIKQLAVFGLPASGLAAAALNIAGFLGVGGRNSHLLNMAGAGAFAAFMYEQGAGVGAEHARKHKDPIVQAGAGAVGHFDRTYGHATLPDLPWNAHQQHAAAVGAAYQY